MFSHFFIQWRLCLTEVNGLELTHWTKCHSADCGKTTDDENREMTDQVRQIWVNWMDRNSWQTVGRKATAYTRAIPSCGMAWAPCGYPGHGLYKSCTSRRTVWVRSTLTGQKKKGQQDATGAMWWCLLFLTYLSLCIFYCQACALQLNKICPIDLSYSLIFALIWTEAFFSNHILALFQQTLTLFQCIITTENNFWPQ